MTLLCTAFMLATFGACTLCSEVRKPPKMIKPVEQSGIQYTNEKNSGGPWSQECQAESKPASKYQWMDIDEKGVLTDVVTKKASAFTVDSTTGTLTLKYINKKYSSDKHDGTYVCKAEVTFKDGQKAASLSSPIILKKLESDTSTTKGIQKVEALEYGYLKLECPLASTQTQTGGRKVQWARADKEFKTSNTDRLNVDINGALHFTYLEKDDISDKTTAYNCKSVGSKAFEDSAYVGEYAVDVKPSIVGSLGLEPRLVHNNGGVAQLIDEIVFLECIFAGFDPEHGNLTIVWRDHEGKEIENGEKFTVSKDKHRLRIQNVVIEDEMDYYCMGENEYGVSGDHRIFLNLVSPPVFINDIPHDMIIAEGEDVDIMCEAKSLPGEEPTGDPVWYINGEKADPSAKPDKYKFTETQLTVTSVSKATDVTCFQCRVANNYGDSWGQSCLTIVLPITVKQKPNPIQTISKGDVVDFSYGGVEGDPISGEITEVWWFRNKNSTLPPSAELTNDKKIIIDTAKLSQESYLEIEGSYVLRLKNKDTSTEIEVAVLAQDGKEVIEAVKEKRKKEEEKEEEEFPWWIIILVLMIIILILIGVIVFLWLKYKKIGKENDDIEEEDAEQDPELEAAVASSDSVGHHPDVQGSSSLSSAKASPSTASGWSDHTDYSKTNLTAKESTI